MGDRRPRERGFYKEPQSVANSAHLWSFWAIWGWRCVDSLYIVDSFRSVDPSPSIISDFQLTSINSRVKSGP